MSGVSSTGPAGDADDGRAPSLDAPLLPDRSAVDGPKPSGEGTTPETGVQAVRDETVALLARTMDPAAYDRRAVAANLGQSWDRFTRRQAVEAHAEAAVAAGWVRVVEDGDTIERLAELLTNWFEGKGRAAFWDSQDMARAAVRALREET